MSIKDNKILKWFINIVLVIHGVLAVVGLIERNIISNDQYLLVIVGMIVLFSIKGLLDNKIYLSRGNTSNLSDNTHKVYNIIFLTISLIAYIILWIEILFSWVSV